MTLVDTLSNLLVGPLTSAILREVNTHHDPHSGKFSGGIGGSGGGGGEMQVATKQNVGKILDKAGVRKAVSGTKPKHISQGGGVERTSGLGYQLHPRFPGVLISHSGGSGAKIHDQIKSALDTHGAKYTVHLGGFEVSHVK